MRRLGWLIFRYLFTTITPYFIFAWLILSVILFVQQASRYSDIYFSVNIPSNLIWQLTVALIPNVIAFTCPMAMLIGTIIGLSKMQGDSEIVAIKASGVGNFSLAIPSVLLGLLMSGFALYVNLEGVPLAASLVRAVALQSAIKKLESPIEPGVFNTEVAGYTIYVKGGDFETSSWKNIFIYSEDKPNNSLRLITSRRGRIDTTGERSELVLENATVSTLPLYPGQGKYISENISEVRFAIRTRRNELIEKLSLTEFRPEELGLSQLSEYASNRTGAERNEAYILWQRRILLSITPLLFCLLGTVIVLRFERSGRGFGIAVGLVVLVAFYLLAFVGEQLARTGTISVAAGSAIPIAGAIAALLWLALSSRIELLRAAGDAIGRAVARLRGRRNRPDRGSLFVDLTTGIRDFDLLWNLVANFTVSLLFLAAIFVIFTAFDLWKFAGTFDGGVSLLMRYLGYLLPFVFLQIAPSAAMIATLATYVVKSRNNEIVTWTSAGQSVYRLLMPCFLISMMLGAGSWALQEYVLPEANQRQDEIRTLIRSKGVAPANTGKIWLANDRRIYSFHFGTRASGSQQMISASDNERDAAVCGERCVRDLIVYEFADNGERLQVLYRSDLAEWRPGKILFLGKVEVSDLAAGQISTRLQEGGEIAETLDPFGGLKAKPTHLNSEQLAAQIDLVESDVEYRQMTVALQRKYTTAILPLVVVLFTAPFALSLTRKGKAATIGYAVMLWLLFTGAATIFEQLGISGMLPAAAAVWTPVVIFAFIGVFLLSRVRT